MTNSNTAQTKEFKRRTEGYSRFDVSCTNYHTTGFMCNRPVLLRELAPKQHIHYVVDCFTRTPSTLQPLFGHFDGRLSAFFVPYAMIWTKFNEFIEQTLRNGTLPDCVPVVDQQDIIKAIVDYVRSSDGETVATSASSGQFELTNTGASPVYVTAPDMVVKNYVISSSNIKDVYLRFTSQSLRNLISSLEGLGYILPRYWDFNDANLLSSEEWSALPLLTWDKVWYDFYKVQGVNSYPFEPDMATMLSVSQLETLFRRMAKLSVAYPKSYLANSETPDAAGQTNYHASSNANQPKLFFDARSDSSTIEGIDEQTTTGGTANHFPSGERMTYSSNGDKNTNTYAKRVGYAPSGGTPNLYQKDINGNVGLTDLAISQLGRMTDYVKRISVAGFNSMKRFLAEYGIEIDETQVLKTAEFLGDYAFSINMQEVTSTDSANLGSQTGASLKGNSKFVIDYTAKEFGALIVYYNIRPKTEFLRQRPRWITSHKAAFDFYKPDFDGFGYQGTRLDELHVYQGVTSSTGYFRDGLKNNTLGVVPVYGEYKTSYSVATGDFARKSIENTMNPYHTATLLDESVTGAISSRDLLFPNNIAMNPERYLRVFGNSVYDPFICHIDFNGYIDAPMRPLFELPGEWSCSGAGGRMNGDERSHL